MQQNEKIKLTYYNVFVRILGVPKGCRKEKTTSHDVIKNLPNYTPEMMKELLKKATQIMADYKSVTHADLHIIYTESDGFFEESMMYDTRHKKINMVGLSHKYMVKLGLGRMMNHHVKTFEIDALGHLNAITIAKNLYNVALDQEIGNDPIRMKMMTHEVERIY